MAEALKPWIGVDFDGTLAHAKTGAPIPPMVERVKRWLRQGVEVKIVTARANPSFPNAATAVDEVNQFCTYYFGHELPITYSKDHMMVSLWDDRAVQVEHNTGKVLGVAVERPI